MLDLKFIREYPDLVREGIRKKGAADSIDDVLKLDAQRRELIQKGEALKSKRNSVSEEVGKLKRAGKDASGVMAEMESVNQQIKMFDDDLRAVDEALRQLLLAIPNVPH